MNRPADLLFYLFAALTLAGASGAAFLRNLLYSAWSLLFCFLGVAGLYIFLGADFPAVAQILIYIGGVLVLILFAVMLTRKIGEDPKHTNPHIGLWGAVILAAALAATLSYAVLHMAWPEPALSPAVSTAQQLGQALLGDALLPFEAISLVLLAALIGAVVLARRAGPDDSAPGIDHSRPGDELPR